MALPARLFCDTSFFYACFDQHDVNHERARQLSEESRHRRLCARITWDIISETATLLRYRRTYREALTFLLSEDSSADRKLRGRPCAQKRNEFSGRYGRDRKLSV